jgi:hypothetical protein
MDRVGLSDGFDLSNPCRNDDVDALSLTNADSVINLVLTLSGYMEFYLTGIQHNYEQGNPYEIQ